MVEKSFFTCGSFSDFQFISQKYLEFDNPQPFQLSEEPELTSLISIHSELDIGSSIIV